MHRMMAKRFELGPLSATDVVTAVSCVDRAVEDLLDTESKGVW
jgi:hypothetical protein